MDQGYIGRMPAVLFKGLTEKSRDEIEQHFMVNEQPLTPHEQKEYVYVIFDLQRFFKELVAKRFPQGLDQEKIDRHFLEEICRLNQTPEFWGGKQAPEELHEYLARYAIMFFDNDFGYSAFLDDYVKEFMNRHRNYRPPPQSAVSADEAAKIFGIKKETLSSATKRGLARLYRQRAQELHPDAGGDHENFIKLTEAYQSLLRTKKENP
jgi:hypothetical protein